MSTETLAMATETVYREKVEQLKARLLPASSALIVTHDYPDPDCLASAFGVSRLLMHWGVKSPVITFGGFIGRAENRAMIRSTGIQSLPFMLVSPSDYERIIVVDSFPGLGNVPLQPTAEVDAVLDHHPNTPDPDAHFYHDIRVDLGATSTLVTKYLLAAECPITPELATALFYGIKTDTNDMGRRSSKEDLQCYRTLFDLTDFNMLSSIESPGRDAEYFRVLHRSVESMHTYGNFGYAHLGPVTTPDFIAEIADLFHSLETLEWMICSGIFKRQIFYSVRSKEEERAGIVAEQIAQEFGGSGGGHSTMAAGRIPLNGTPTDDILRSFLAKLKALFGIENIPAKGMLEQSDNTGE